MSKHTVLACTLFFTILSSSLPARTLAAESDSRVQLLAHGGHSLARIREQILSAQTSIEVAYYIFESCHTSGKIVVDALTEASRRANMAGRPLAIRVLLDGTAHPQESKPAFVAAMKARGIDVRFFSDVTKFNPSFNNRNHTKFIVVDKSTLISGGRNIGDDYFGLHDEMNYIDKDVFVEGPVARKAAEVFDSYWNNSISSRPSASASAKDIAAFENTCLRITERETRALAMLPSQFAELNAEFPSVTCPTVDFVTDRLYFNIAQQRDGRGDLPARYLDDKLTTKTMLSLLGRAKEKIRTENFSFIPPFRIFDLLKSLEKKGVMFEAVINARTVDDDYVSLAGDWYKKKMEGPLLQVHSLLPFAGNVEEDWFMNTSEKPWFLHSKTYTIDGRTSIVSSYNIDPRSYHTNYESLVVVPDCPAFAKVVDDQISVHANKAIEADERGEESDEEDPTLEDWFLMFLSHDLL